MIDYIIVDDELNDRVRDILIDEDCLQTPFRRVTERKQVRAQYSDHNSITAKFEMNNEDQTKVPEVHSQEVSWIFNESGWKKFNEITSVTPCPINSENETDEEYNKLESYIKEALSASFKIRSVSKKSS